MADANRAFRNIPLRGVIRVVVDAMKQGYSADDPTEANLRQGHPEVGPIEGAPPRLDHVPVHDAEYAYGPVEGLPKLRDTIAAHDDRLYRRGQASRYSARNVVVEVGGRTSLTRAVRPGRRPRG